ncbi:Protein of unknown function (DUF 659) [Nesidiocoris tenuis]|uniref:HAT C-terminal dimerisation domain-containing protein n=1 Tax=Nesidiocoris tenuis TaxID=355587 RepID=A0ABN7A5P6_9HEMI|nr:Protein of unknown function (DUF 659) [Nesidiocoris tenuis]
MSDVNPKSEIEGEEEDGRINKFQNRKANAVKPIHLAACLLNPHSQGSECTSVEIIDAMEFISDLADKMPVNESQAMAELAGYRSKRDGVWGKPFLWKCLNDEAGRKMSPIDWWTGFLGNTELSKVACRILSAPASSAATERTFSRFSWIHSKKKKPANVGKGGKNNVGTLATITPSSKTLWNQPATSCPLTHLYLSHLDPRILLKK